MHQLYFVYLEKELKIRSSRDARETAEERLDSNGFCSDGGYFSGGKGDWFRIGGRWSGILTLALGKEPTKDEEYIKNERARYDEYRKDKTGAWGPNQMTDEQFKKRVEEFMKHTKRDPYEAYPDSTMKLDAKLLKAIQSKKGKFKYIRDCEVFLPERNEELKIPDLNKTDLGGWLVVVDYHW